MVQAPCVSRTFLMALNGMDAWPAATSHKGAGFCAPLCVRLFAECNPRTGNVADREAVHALLRRFDVRTVLEQDPVPWAQKKE